MTRFESLGLNGTTLKGVQKAGYNSPTPIQSATIPIALEGRDVIGCAQTGTGKTAAFVLPMLQGLVETTRPRGGRPIRALVVTPTRELAIQVEHAIRSYGSFNRLWSATLYGGVSIAPQIRQLRKGVEIVVATPGRLLDHVERGTADLSQIEILVLDEADRMLDMGFIGDIRRIVAETPSSRQTMLFSATMPKAIQALTKSIQRNPEFVEVGERRNPAETVNQQVCKVAAPAKMDLLYHVLSTESTDNVLIFSRTKHRADRIVRKLGRNGFSATVMHSNRSQNQRQASLDGFRRGKYQIMVATDIAARGIDVDRISHVINFDTPRQAEDYIHRIGRTGRAEAKGEAITFVAREEEGYLRDIERHTGRQLARKIFDDFAEAHPQRTEYGKQRTEPAGRQNGSRKSERTKRSDSSQITKGTDLPDRDRPNGKNVRPRRSSQRRHQRRAKYGR